MITRYKKQRLCASHMPERFSSLTPKFVASISAHLIALVLLGIRGPCVTNELDQLVRIQPFREATDSQKDLKSQHLA